jgi:hypothetical protein
MIGTAGSLPRKTKLGLSKTTGRGVGVGTGVGVGVGGGAEAVQPVNKTTNNGTRHFISSLLSWTHSIGHSRIKII